MAPLLLLLLQLLGTELFVCPTMQNRYNSNSTGKSDLLAQIKSNFVIISFKRCIRFKRIHEINPFRDRDEAEYVESGH